MSSIICTMPACQTSAGCVCGRTTYTPPFSPTVADTYWANEVKTLNEQIATLTRELAEARDKALEEAAKVADEAERNWTKIESKTVYEERYAASTAADASRDIATALRAMKEKP